MTTPEPDPTDRAGAETSPTRPREGPSDENPLYRDPITDDAIAKEAVSAWLTTFIASPAGHRSNAQNGYTIAAAVATALVGAGILTSADEAPLWVQIPLLISLALWLWTAWKFMVAVAFQPNLGGVKHAADLKTLGTVAIQRTWLERSNIAKAGKRARRAAAAAGIVTFLSFVLVLARPTVGKIEATVALTTDGAKHVTALCDQAPTNATLAARVDPQALENEVVVLEDVACPDPKTKRTLRLVKADIAGTATH